jgi:hypothetical protein
MIEATYEESSEKTKNHRVVWEQPEGFRIVFDGYHFLLERSLGFDACGNETWVFQSSTLTDHRLQRGAPPDNKLIEFITKLAVESLKGKNGEPPTILDTDVAAGSVIIGPDGKVELTSDILIDFFNMIEEKVPSVHGRTIKISLSKLYSGSRSPGRHSLRLAIRRGGIEFADSKLRSGLILSSPEIERLVLGTPQDNSEEPEYGD